MPEVGDRVAVASNKMGTPPREGVVRAVSGRMVTIEWSNGGQTMLTAAPGSIAVLGRSRARKAITKAAPAARKASPAKKAAAPAKQAASAKKVSAPAKKAAPVKKAGTGTKKTAAAKAPAKASALGKTTGTAKKAPAKKAPTKKAPAKKAPAKGGAKKR